MKTETAQVAIWPCTECGMMVGKVEYHPYAACLMFKASKSATIVRDNLTAVIRYGKDVANAGRI